MLLFFFKKLRYHPDMNRPLIIAVVAEKGAGKGLFIDIVRELSPDKKVASVRFSDIWREILHLLNKEESRENISNLATAIRALFHDDGVLVAAMESRLTTMQADIIILDGLRKQEEVEPLVRKQNGILLSITASPEARFQRRREHAETTDERGMDWEQFMRQEQLAPEISIRTIGETMAGATIENNGTVEEFKQKIKQFMEAHVLPRVKNS